MNHLPNRVLKALNDWDDHQKDLEKTFQHSKMDAESVSLLRLNYLRREKNRIEKIARSDEMPFIVLLQRQIARLERELYPNLFLRVFMRLKDRWLDGPAHFSRQAAIKNANFNALTEQLRQSGFNYINGKLDQYLQDGSRLVSIPLSCQLNEVKCFTARLHFQQNIEGSYFLERIAAELLEKGGSVRSHSFELKNWPGIEATQMLNLLEGKAIKQHFLNAEGRSAERWLELGKYGVQSYHPDKPFDLHTILNELGIPLEDGRKIINQLENGHTVPVVLKSGKITRPVSLQADPANGCIRVTDVEKLNVSPIANQNSLRQKAAEEPGLTPGSLQKRKVSNRRHVKL
ncbi:hypothetical protein D0C36_22715 [Mucilaginibacter conchicola]|uniref:Uncharacterized protein n=1 Tax=Mucilaginibacter conchicola TaxID=2303333 RepID=A0A372NMH6_9SPHI|nr:hypothetical protein [Mucilaginibacter conchicola]RFZ90058.1 hypothetical protein D0C36_22715 [Mucilaginibacter conchicola]